MKMYKLFLMISFTLLLSAKIFGQAAVDIPFSVTDGTWTANLSIGLDLTATTCIDSALGEYVFNVMPPAGVFDSRLDLAPYGCGTTLFTLKDYRPPGDPPAFPFSGMIEHTLAFQTSSIGMSIYIQYNLPPGTTMIITDQIGGSFLNIGPFTGQGIAMIPGSYTMIFSRALLKMEYDNIVPVELTSFTASVLQNEKVVRLNWSTATETNNSGFEIERQVGIGQSAVGNQSGDRNCWETIGFVPGFGTTTEPKSYSFTDENVTTGTYKYRLKQIDFDGSFELSNEIEVVVDFTPKEFVLYQNYPNPFNPSTTIKFEIPSVTLRQAQSDIMVSLKVYDVLGNEVATLVNEEKQPGVYEVEFDASSVAAGMYLYKLQASSPKGQAFVQTKKMALLR